MARHPRPGRYVYVDDGSGKKRRLATPFWEQVAFGDGCWEWTGGRVGSYGVVHFEKRSQRAHRVAWQLTFGPIPEGLFVCHHCDNPPCVRPSHLFLGTNNDNIADRVKKGRTTAPRPLRGERHPLSKVTEAQVREMRSLYPAVGLDDLAERYGVDRTTVGSIVWRQRWKHVA